MAPGAEEEKLPVGVDRARSLAGYDLTSKMTPFLDRHLIFPILNFLQEAEIYKKNDVIKALIALLKETNMIDFAIDLYSSIEEEVPAEVTERREKVLEHLSTSRERVLPVLELLEKPEEVAKITTFKSIGELCAEFKIEATDLDELVIYAKLQFDCGNYALCGELLKHYRSMMAQDSERPLTSSDVSVSWGSLASFMLNRDFEEASKIIFKLDEYLENSKMSKREVLLQRTWLLHWTLFAIFAAENVPVKLLDFFLNEKNLSIISLSCPHLFRYVGACLILQKRLKHLVKDTVWIIHHESCNYSDPITRFLLALYTDMDFDEAQRELQKCELACESDYFLKQHWAEFQENARLLIFEAYCRIHQCINIGMIATKLNMGAEEAELWIVKLIQNAKLDARIDSEKSRVVMSKAPPSVYQQVIEKTKNLSFRSTMLISNLEKRDREREVERQTERVEPPARR